MLHTLVSILKDLLLAFSPAIYGRPIIKQEKPLYEDIEVGPRGKKVRFYRR